MFLSRDISVNHMIYYLRNTNVTELKKNPLYLPLVHG